MTLTVGQLRNYLRPLPDLMLVAVAHPSGNLVDVLQARVVYDVQTEEDVLVIEVDTQ